MSKVTNLVPTQDPIDLTVALHALNELAKQDGDLRAAYWQSVIKLLSSAGEVQAELLELRRTLLH